MAQFHSELGEFANTAYEALSRYKLRTSLSVVGVVLGVAAVIAMMSVSEGAGREALSQVEALGMDNLVIRSRVTGLTTATANTISAADADRLSNTVPLVRRTALLIDRFVRISHGDRSSTTRVLGVQASFAPVLRLTLQSGRFLSITDEQTMARRCVLGAGLARQLFGFRQAVGDRVRIGGEYFEVVGVIADQVRDARATRSITWRDVSNVAFAPLAAVSGRSLRVVPVQPVDEIWLQVADGARALEVSRIVERGLLAVHRAREFDVVVPRELLAQRYRTQRTFSVVVGSVAVLALLVGGIGIMNIMLTSVVERTQEIGLRRTVGATRRHIAAQFLVEALMMTTAGGVLGVTLGSGIAVGITRYAEWATHVSPIAVTLALGVSMVVGLVFGLYPAIKAAHLEPVDAVRYE